MESTLVILKPDGVLKNLLLPVIERFEKEGLIVSHLKEMQLTKELLEEHYAHLLDRDFYPLLEEFMLSSKVYVMIVRGNDAIKRVRDIIGDTNPQKALPDTIRGMYGDKECVTKNVIHASDSIVNAIIEIERFYYDNKEISDNNKTYILKK